MDLNKAAMMARDLMNFHGLTDWHFKFDRSLTRLGYCRHGKKIISLGRHATVVNPMEQVLNTITHEIAHALVGWQHGHDDVWRAKAKEIGCTGERLGDIAIKAPHKYYISCRNCNTTVTKFYRVSKRYVNSINNMWHISCGKEQSKGKLVLERV